MKAIALAAAAAALALAPAATAKEGAAGYQVCGPDACASIGHGSESVVVLDSGSERPPPPPGPYYVIDYKEQHAVPYYFRPDRDLVGAKLGMNGGISWYTVDGTTLRRLRAATAKLDPYGAPADGGSGRDWTPWLVVGGLILLAAGATFLLKGAPMKRLAAHFLLVLAAALALAATASAKEIQTAQACGPAGDCAAMDKDGTMLLLNSGGSISQPPPTAEYYRLDFVFGEPGTNDHNAFSHLFVPSKGLVGFGDENGGVAWFPVYGQALDTVRNAIRNIDPFPAPKAWPTSIEDPIFTPGRTASPAPDDGPNWQPWAIGAMLLLLALAAGALLARRTRVRRPETA